MEFSGNERVNGVTCRGWGLLIKEPMVGRVCGGDPALSFLLVSLPVPKGVPWIVHNEGSTLTCQ